MIPACTQEVLRRAVEEGRLPGAALGVVDAGGERATLALGHAALEPEPVPLDEEFWWDLASLTKPLFTAREVLRGVEAGVLSQAEVLLRGGWLSPAGQAAALSPQAPGRTLAFVAAQPGWSGGSLAGAGAFGHTGFTGTGLWVDPARGLAWVLLTNRVHPSRHGPFDIQTLRRAVGNTLLAGRE